MVFQDEQQIYKYILANEKPKDWVISARQYTDLLFALIDGRDFQVLLEYIEKYEGSDEKAIARRKYARSIKDLFERLLRLTDNIYSSTGGVKRYENISETQKEELLKHLHNIKGGKSLEGWLECFWKELYHLDPNGIIFFEYDAELDIKPYPTYKSIKAIRHYLSDGQMCKTLLFEPIQLGDTNTQVWRVVDDVYEYEVYQTGDVLNVENQFEHNFGKVPAIINSDIEKIGSEELKLSPVDKVIEITKEYARDLSIKTIYKFLQGFPKHWKYVAPCDTCHGLGKDGDGKTCGDCGGTGEKKGNDVTDEIHLRIPEGDENVLAPDIAGFISPDIATWDKFDGELKLLEDTIHLTHWGNIGETSAVRTATETVIDTQPTIQRLNKYADVAENVERMSTELIANHMFTRNSGDKPVSSIKYGRNYIIESTNQVLTDYQNSKEAGDSATILDDKYRKVLLASYKNDFIGLERALLKSEVEPYLHFTVEQLNEVSNSKEAQRKLLFEDWWKSLEQTQFDKTAESLRENYNKWFEKKFQKQTNEQIEVQQLNEGQTNE